MHSFSSRKVLSQIQPTLAAHSSLHWAICNPKAGEQLFDCVIIHGADPLLVDRRGYNGLHYAARANNLGALENILELGPEVGSVDGFGWIPFYWVVVSIRVSTQVIKALLRLECNMEMKDMDGRTALDLAIMLDNSEPVAIWNDTGETYMDQLENGVTIDGKPHSRFCDGCLIVRALSKDNECHAGNSSF